MHVKFIDEMMTSLPVYTVHHVAGNFVENYACQNDSIGIGEI